jgi:hypothetical protein
LNSIAAYVHSGGGSEEKVLFDQSRQERAAGLFIQPPETPSLGDRQLKARHLQVFTARPFNQPIGNRVRSVVRIAIFWVAHVRSVALLDRARHLGPSLGGPDGTAQDTNTAGSATATAANSDA